MSKHDIRVKTKHSHLIVDNGEIVLRSVFDFTGGCEELFPFLYECERRNCIVRFENEEITVDPNSDNAYLNVKLSMYAMLGQKDCRIVSDFLNYMRKLSFEYEKSERVPTRICENDEDDTIIHNTSEHNGYFVIK